MLAFLKKHALSSVLGISLPVLLWIATLIPPIQSPDEYQHLYRAYMVSTGQWLLHSPGEDGALSVFQRQSQIGGEIDHGLIEYKNAYWSLVKDPGRELTSDEQNEVSKIGWQKTSHFEKMPGAGYYFPLIYAPQALGFFIGQSLDLNVHASYWLSRILTTVTCLVLLGFAIKAVRPSALGWALLFMPMSIFQILSPTIDGLTLSLAMLALSLFVCDCEKPATQNTSSVVAITFCIFMLVTTRTHLLPMLILPFYLAWKNQNFRDLSLICLVSFVALFWVGFSIVTGHDGRVPHNSSVGALLWHYASHPWAYIEMIWNSVSDPNTFVHYERSFIGILGWLNVLLPENAYPLLWVGLGLCSVASIHIGSKQTAHVFMSRGLLFVLALISMGLIFLAMLVTWTPINAVQIEGIQGRYFTIPVLMMAFALSDYASVRSKRRQLLANTLAALQVTASLWALTTALLARYD